MLSTLKSVTRHLIRLAGYEVVRTNAVPRFTLMGLRDRTFDVLIDIGANRGEFFDYFVGFFPA